VLQSIGPTNTRRYHVAVYFRGERLATGIGHSIQQAEMNTAANALREKAGIIIYSDDVVFYIHLIAAGVTVISPLEPISRAKERHLPYGITPGTRHK